MGEIRIVGPGTTRGYPYPVCKNKDVCTCISEYLRFETISFFTEFVI